VLPPVPPEPPVGLLLEPVGSPEQLRTSAVSAMAVAPAPGENNSRFKLILLILTNRDRHANVTPFTAWYRRPGKRGRWA
jgi:hypothetical protein